MKKTLLVVTFLGVVVIIAGFVMMYSGTDKDEVDTKRKSFSFGNYYFLDYSANKTYLDGGNFTFYNCKSDTLEILAIHPPARFNQSKLVNVYFAVWEGGIKQNLPQNTPNALIRLKDPGSNSSVIPKVYQFSSVEDTVSFELIADETYQNLGNSSTWTVDFARIHALAGNADLVTPGILLFDTGIAVIFLANLLLAKLTSKTAPSTLNESKRASILKQSNVLRQVERKT